MLLSWVHIYTIAQQRWKMGAGKWTTGEIVHWGNPVPVPLCPPQSDMTSSGTEKGPPRYEACDLSSESWYEHFFPPGATQPIVGVYFTALYWALASSCTRLLDHTQRRATLGRIPLNEWSVRRRDLYLTTHNTHNRQTSMPRVGFFFYISFIGLHRQYIWLLRSNNSIQRPEIYVTIPDRSRRTAVDLRLRPRGYWDRQDMNIPVHFWMFYWRQFL
jgi:hypothetical protein